VNLKPPEIGDKLVPVFTEDELAAILSRARATSSAPAGHRPSSPVFEIRENRIGMSLSAAPR
jgi:hypothetical protein